MNVNGRSGSFGARWHRAAAAVAVAALCAGLAADEPTTQRALDSISGRTREIWRSYRVAWTGRDIVAQSVADQKLVDEILKGELSDVAALRTLMTRDYDFLMSKANHDDFHTGRLASRIAVAWTRGPLGETPTAADLARSKKLMCEETVRWSLRALECFAGTIAPEHWSRYKVFLPGTANSMLSLLASRGLVIDDPAAVHRTLAKLRPRLAALAKADPQRQARQQETFDRYFDMTESFEALTADKRAILAVLAKFPAAYNDRDDAAMAALFPPGHAAAETLKTSPLAKKVEPGQWKIDRWQVVYIAVKSREATAYVAIRYAAKDGKVGQEKLEAYPVRCTAQGVWLMG